LYVFACRGGIVVFSAWAANQRGWRFSGVHLVANRAVGLGEKTVDTADKLSIG
jgi:hypothetical protein